MVTAAFRTDSVSFVMKRMSVSLQCHFIALIHIRSSYIFSCAWGKGEAPVWSYFSIICICHVHSSSFAFINQFIMATLHLAGVTRTCILSSAAGPKRYCSGTIMVYEACDAMCHHCWTPLCLCVFRHLHCTRGQQHKNRNK